MNWNRAQILYVTRALEEIHRIGSFQGEVKKGFVANFFGSLIDLSFLKSLIDEYPDDSFFLTWLEQIGAPRAVVDKAALMDQFVEVPPPMVESGEYFFETAALIHAVKSARERFVMAELGGGFAARSVNAALIARRLNPLPQTFLVVEPNPTHTGFARRHFQENGVQPSDYRIVPTLVGSTAVPRLITIEPASYGARIFDADWVFARADEDGMVEPILLSLLKRGTFFLDNGGRVELVALLPTTTLDALLVGHDRVDLVDMDIQGCEAELIPAAIDVLNEKVRLVHIGTHHDQRHSDIERRLRGNGWEILASFPPFQRCSTPFGSFTSGDGIITASNTRFPTP